MAELKNIRIAVSGLYDYALEELPTLRIPFPKMGAPEWVEEKRLYKVYRPAPVLAAACDKFKMLPLTHHHPKTLVDGQNFRDLALGYTGENPWVDYIKENDEVGIRSTLMLYDDEALRAYENGEVQLSPGYVATFEWKKGTAPNGEEYDIIMKEITDVNHLALLPAGRGGEYAVVLDNAAEDTEKDTKKDTAFDIVRKTLNYYVCDVKYEDGHISHRADGDYIKENGEFRKLSKEEKTDREIERQNLEAQKLVEGLKTYGYDAKVEKSRREWGNSTYIYPTKNGKRLFYKGNLIVFRLSDHPYWREDRHEINIKNSEQVIKSLGNMERNMDVELPSGELRKYNPLTDGAPKGNDNASKDHVKKDKPSTGNPKSTITDESAKIKTIFEIISGSVFDRVKR